MPLGNWEGGQAMKRSQDISPGGSFRLKRFDILKMPSEQSLGCSDFIFWYFLRI